MAVAPNPFSRQATLTFTVPDATYARLAVYDVLGRRVAVLAEGAHTATRHAVALDLVGLPAGVYVARLEVGGQTAARAFSVAR